MALVVFPLAGAQDALRRDADSAVAASIHSGLMFVTCGMTPGLRLFHS